jgi:hypothetical protein
MTLSLTLTLTRTPEQPDEIALGETGGQQRYYQHKFPQLTDAAARASF